MPKKTFCLLVLTSVASVNWAKTLGQPQRRVPDLTELSLAEFMDIETFSVSPPA